MGIIRKLLRNRILIHLLFSLSVVGCIVYINKLGFNITGVPAKSSWIGQYLGCFFILFCIYLGRWISRKYWYNNIPQRNFFLISLICWVAILTCWWGVVVLFFAPTAGFLELTIAHGPFLTIAFIGGILIKLVRTSISNQISNAKSAAEQSKSELSVLQSHLSPHFLFNTLNNLYGISLTQHEKIPALLLKLSELLRYSVYDAKEMFVPLKDEIAYLNNYIQFEEIRIGNRLVLNNLIEEKVDSNIKIAPMLLIIFIENAFKHAKDTTELQMFIDLKLNIKDDSIYFTSRNSHTTNKSENNITHKNSGFGLSSVTRRLELLYPKEYYLKIENSELYYFVELKLKIK